MKIDTYRNLMTKLSVAQLLIEEQQRIYVNTVAIHLIRILHNIREYIQFVTLQFVTLLKIYKIVVMKILVLEKISPGEQFFHGKLVPR